MKLFWTIYVAAVLAFAIVAAVACITAVTAEMGYRQAAEEAQAAQEAAYAVKVVERGFARSEWPVEALERLRLAPGFRFWWVVAPNGAISMADNPALVGASAWTRFPAGEHVVTRHRQRWEERETRQLVAVSVNPLRTSPPLGWTLWLGYSTADLGAVARNTAMQVTWLSLLALVVFGTIMYWVIRRSLRPLQTLIEGATRLGQGDLGYRAPLGPDNELGQLAGAFNVMAAGLQERQTQLEQELGERRRAEAALRESIRRQRMFSEANQTLVRAVDEASLLSQVCHGIVEIGEYQAAWAGLCRTKDATELEPAVHATAAAGRDGVTPTWPDSEVVRHLIQEAARTGRPAMEVRADEVVGGLVAGRTTAGLTSGSCIALPLMQSGRVTGVLSIEVDRPRPFDDEELGLLLELATDLAYGLGALRNQADKLKAEEALGESQRQLLQSQKMEALGRLAGGVAHDFNNLLTPILVLTGMARESVDEGSTLAKDLADVQHAAQRAADLTRKLLTIGRRRIAELHTLDPNAALTALEPLLRRAVGEDIELEMTLAPDAGAVRVDPSGLDQVILNLVVNARDAMPKGGKLFVATQAVTLDAAACQSIPRATPGEYVVLLVRDTGCGMSASVREHLFEPFFTTKDLGKGTGLGLSTVYGLVKQFSGYIALTSEIGQGTEFRIYLPRHHGPIQSVSATSGAALPRGTETVLVVEDDDNVRPMAVRILKMLGYHVLEARSGVEALELARHWEGPLHLVFSDVIMPQLSGPDMVARLRGLRQDFKVLFVSGYAEDAVNRQTTLRPEDPLLPKPYTSAIIATTVRAVLDGVPTPHLLRT